MSRPNFIDAIAETPLPFALSDLLAGSVTEAPRLVVSGVNADSRALASGEAFFALPGLHTHGDAHATEARARGAVAMVTDRPPPGDPGMPVVLVNDVRAAYARAAVAQFAPLPNEIVAVTGTAGKSSIVSFVRQIWSAAGYKAASVGTVGIETAAGLMPGELTTPDPLSLARALGRLKADGIEHVAMEASSQGLDQRRVDGLRFSAVAFSNLSRDHLDYHVDMDAYRQAKLRLFTDLIAEGGAAIVNVDDPGYEPFMFAALEKGAILMTVGREGAWFENLSTVEEGMGQRVTGRLVGEEISFHLPLTGSFQASNAIVALGLAMAGGMPKAKALATLPRLKGARGRLELVGEYNGAAIFVDYAHKPVALESALAALRPHARNALSVVFGAGGDRDKGKRPIMGEIASRLADAVYVTDDNPRSEDPRAIRAEIMTAAPKAREIGDRREAIAVAVKALQPGDVLLIAGKGHEDYQIVGTTKTHFSDHEVVAETLKGL